MPTIPAGFAECAFVFQCTGRPRVATWSLGVSSPDFSTQAPADIAEIMYGFFTGTTKPYFASHMCSGWTFRGVSCTKQLEDGPITGQFFQDIVGTASNGPVPVNTSMLITKQTTAGGRRNRGRGYVPPVWPPEEDVDQAGVIAPTQLGQLQGWYDAAFLDMTDAEYVPELYHGTAPFTPTPISGLSVGSQMATQRRRMRS